LFVPINIGERLHHRLQQCRLIVFHAEQIVFAEVLQHLQQRTIRESGIAGEQLNEGIFLEKVFGVLLQTITFVRLITFDGLLGKDKIEVVNEEVEHVNGSATGESKLLGSFSVNGGGQITMFGKQKPKEVGHGLLKIFEGEFCQRA
jgi:hypothetical protein